MEKLSLTIENELNILEKYHLTAEEWLVVRLLFLASIEENHIEYLNKYAGLPDRSSFIDILTNLQSKGIILKSYEIPKREVSKGVMGIAIPDLAYVEFNKLFLKDHMKYSYEMGNELYNEYPVNIMVNGILNSARTTGNKYKELPDMFFAYGKAIGFKESKHKKVLELLRWGKENNLINKALYRFIADEEWRNLEAMKSQGVCNYYDNVRTL